MDQLSSLERQLIDLRAEQRSMMRGVPSGLLRDAAVARDDFPSDLGCEHLLRASARAILTDDVVEVLKSSAMAEAALVGMKRVAAISGPRIQEAADFAQDALQKHAQPYDFDAERQSPMMRLIQIFCVYAIAADLVANDSYRDPRLAVTAS